MEGKPPDLNGSPLQFGGAAGDESWLVKILANKVAVGPTARGKGKSGSAMETTSVTGFQVDVGSEACVEVADRSGYCVITGSGYGAYGGYTTEGSGASGRAISGHIPSIILDHGLLSYNALQVSRSVRSNKGDQGNGGLDPLRGAHDSEGAEDGDARNASAPGDHSMVGGLKPVGVREGHTKGPCALSSMDVSAPDSLRSDVAITLMERLVIMAIRGFDCWGILSLLNDDSAENTAANAVAAADFVHTTVTGSPPVKGFNGVHNNIVDRVVNGDVQLANSY
ncbi:hypothetical protein AMTR_s00053p00215480 [Amborella trichopoda]|uniref:Uncharacterized protein n=1 Tax=Amborella trichopoda TaxID=13333 RepID=W1PBW7_AMBTC|nr:hypothetical protein AMTR_s00053p00215480 [Amborella trichopoda]